MLTYLKYDDIDIDEELSKIEECKEAQLVIDQTNKKCLFILGMLFVNGAKIEILNQGDLKIFNEGKSFEKMSFVWSRLSVNKFSNDKFELGKKIVDAINDGLKVEKIINYPLENKIFLISPVRNATPEQNAWIDNFYHEKINEGYIVHIPHLHTNQIDPLGGYNICKENAQAIATSSEIDIYYDQSSTGSVFDLGVAYALHKPLRLLNKDEIKFREDDLIDNTIENWPYNGLQLIKR